MERAWFVMCGKEVATRWGSSAKAFALAARWIAITLIVNTIALLLGAVIGLPVYVWPRTDQLRHADAIFVLGHSDFIGPDSYAKRRDSMALELMQEGWAPTVVISDGSSHGDLWVGDKPCGIPHLQCFRPTPPTTLGEGRELRRMAEEAGWKSVIVVTTRPHISRARFILENCFAGDLVMIEGPAETSISRWAFEYVYQTLGFVKAAFSSNC